MSNEKLRRGEHGEHYDSRGRLCTPQGVPYRNASTRRIRHDDGTTSNGVGVAFRGKPGKPHRKATAKLERRRKQFKDEQEGKMPSSNNTMRHQPGSLQFG